MTRYVLRRNYLSGLSGYADWACYRNPLDEEPIAVFLRKSDAVVFQRVKRAGEKRRRK